MGKFLLFVILAGSVGLYLTNPTTAEVQAQLGNTLPPQLTGAPADQSIPGAPPAVPSAPPADSVPPPDADVQRPPEMPAVDPGAPPKMPDVPGALVPEGAMQLDRKDYYLFSVYKVTVGGQQLPGCIVGIAKQAVPMTSCPSG